MNRGSIARADSGSLWGVNWSRHTWGVSCFARNDRGYLVTRNYVGNGSDRVTVRGSVIAFRREIGGAS